MVREPFAELARQLGRPVSEVLEQLSDWLDCGLIRRFGAAVNHRRLGFEGNGMAVFRVPPGREDEVGARLAGYSEVSHCYLRPSLPDWDYTMFAMVHGRSKDQVKQAVARIAAETDLPRHEILFSTVEYKKSSMKYFLPT